MLKEMKRVLITAEALGGTRNSHAKWLYLLLRAPLQSALESAEIVWKTFERDVFTGADLVIGFELSDTARAAIEEAGVPWLDLRIHPLRFMDDIFLAFETNVKAIEEKLQLYRVDEALCRYHADLVRATVIKLKKDKMVPENSLLLVGQTEKDSVIFDGHKYLSLLDRLDAIKSLANSHEHIYFKPHPYARNNRVMLRELRKALGDVRIIRQNVYLLLANDGIGHVAALNSSVLHEAEYFGKETTFLFAPTFEEMHIGVYGDYFNAPFWRDTLSPILPTAPSTLQLPFQPSRLRKTLNDFWGYNALGDEIVLNDIAKARIKTLLGFWR